MSRTQDIDYVLLFFEIIYSPFDVLIACVEFSLFLSFRWLQIEDAMLMFDKSTNRHRGKLVALPWQHNSHPQMVVGSCRTRVRVGEMVQSTSLSTKKKKDFKRVQLSG